MNYSYISPPTIILYISVLLISTLFAFVAEKLKNAPKRKKKDHTRWSFVFSLFLSFLPLYLLLYYSACGADYENYNRLFETADSFSEVFGYGGMEYGFTAFVYIIRQFTKDVNIYNAILGVWFLGSISITLYRLRDRIHIGWAVFCFVSLFFFQYLDLKRIYIAGAIVFFSTPYWLNDERKKVLACLLLALSIHTSSIMILLTYVIYIRWKKYKNVKQIIFPFFAGLVFIIVLRGQINIFGFNERYSDYGIAKETSIGLMQFIYYLPLIYIYITNAKNYINDRLFKFTYVMLITVFSLGILSYFIEMVGRAFVLFMMPILFFPTVMQYRLDNNIMTRSKANSLLCGIFTILYCSFRLYMYFSTYLVLDQISPYITIYGDSF